MNINSLLSKLTKSKSISEKQILKGTVKCLGITNVSHLENGSDVYDNGWLILKFGKVISGPADYGSSSYLVQSQVDVWIDKNLTIMNCECNTPMGATSELEELVRKFRQRILKHKGSKLKIENKHLDELIHSIFNILPVKYQIKLYFSDDDVESFHKTKKEIIREQLNVDYQMAKKVIRHADFKLENLTPDKVNNVWKEIFDKLGSLGYPFGTDDTFRYFYVSKNYIWNHPKYVSYSHNFSTPVDICYTLGLVLGFDFNKVGHSGSYTYRYWRVLLRFATIIKENIVAGKIPLNSTLNTFHDISRNAFYAALEEEWPFGEYDKFPNEPKCKNHKVPLKALKTDRELIYAMAIILAHRDSSGYINEIDMQHDYDKAIKQKQ